MNTWTVECPVKQNYTNLNELIQYIVESYHDELRLAAREFDDAASKLADESSQPGSLRNRLEFELTALVDTIDTHIAEQENWLFPAARHISELNDITEWSGELAEGIEDLMARFTADHKQMRERANTVAGLVSQLDKFTDCAVLDELRDRVQSISQRLAMHAYLETEVLFPWISTTLEDEGLRDNGLSW